MALTVLEIHAARARGRGEEVEVRLIRGGQIVDLGNGN
jgi:hypothetical protein